MKKSLMIIIILATICLECFAQKEEFPEAEITNQYADKLFFDNQQTSVIYLS